MRIAQNERAVVPHRVAEREGAFVDDDAARLLEHRFAVGSALKAAADNICHLEIVESALLIKGLIFDSIHVLPPKKRRAECCLPAASVFSC